MCAYARAQLSSHVHCVRVYSELMATLCSILSHSHSNFTRDFFFVFPRSFTSKLRILFCIHWVSSTLFAFLFSFFLFIPCFSVIFFFPIFNFIIILLAVCVCVHAFLSLFLALSSWSMAVITYTFSYQFILLSLCCFDLKLRSMLTLSLSLSTNFYHSPRFFFSHFSFLTAAIAVCVFIYPLIPVFNFRMQIDDFSLHYFLLSLFLYFYYYYYVFFFFTSFYKYTQLFVT